MFLKKIIIIIFLVSFLNSNNTSVKEEEIYDEFFVLVKDKIEKKSNILNLANQ